MLSQSQERQTPSFAISQQPGVTACRSETDIAVGEPLTDAAREEAIKRAGELMLRKHADFAKSGSFDDMGAAHAALLLQNKLIAGRSPAMVRLLEIKRGLV